jgi:hypothetical protein
MSCLVNVRCAVIGHIMEGPFVDFYRQDLEVSILETSAKVKKKKPDEVICHFPIALVSGTAGCLRRLKNPSMPKMMSAVQTAPKPVNWICVNGSS